MSRRKKLKFANLDGEGGVYIGILGYSVMSIDEERGGGGCNSKILP